MINIIKLIECAKNENIDILYSKEWLFFKFINSVIEILQWRKGLKIKVFNYKEELINKIY